MKREVYKGFQIVTGWLFMGYMFYIYDKDNNLCFSSNEEFFHESGAVDGAKRLIDESGLAE